MTTQSNGYHEWKAPRIAPQSLVADLVEVYFEIAYPIFPFFHRPTFRQKVNRGDYVNDRFTFAVTMAMCALVTARIADRAVYNPRWDVRQLLQVKSETFYAAAVEECGNSSALSHAHFDLLRTCALLAITAIQYGKFREMQTHLGTYHVLVSMDGLHDEENWPDELGIVETEERRRLFWSMYQVDVYSSIVWNGVIRGREQQSSVLYTTELDDDYFDDSGYRTEMGQHSTSPVIIGPSPPHSALNVRSSSWLCGWNFTTNLYRILEHVVTHFCYKRPRKRSFLNDIFDDHSTTPASNVRDSIMTMYNNLPQCFKETQEITCDPHHDRYSFQAANITATIQLLRMVLFSNAGATIGDRCNIASEVVDAFMRIPVQYLRALSSPLLHQLAGIGSILGSVLEEPFEEPAYLQVRVVLLALAQLLESLEDGLHSTTSAEKLRRVVFKIDKRMETQRQQSLLHPYHKQHLYHLHGTPATLPYVAARSSTSDSAGSDGRGSFSNGSQESFGIAGPPHHRAPPQFHMHGAGEVRHDWPWGMDFMSFPES